MPSGAVHTKIQQTGWVVALPSSLILLSPDYRIGLGFVMGYMMGFFIDPDLDQEGITMAEGRMMKLGIFAWPWLSLWLGYAILFKHRGFWSHFPFISTAIRLAWLFLPILCILYYNSPLWYDALYNFVFSNWMVGIFLGLGLADTFHYLADLLGDSLRFLFGGWFLEEERKSRKRNQS